MEKKEWKGILLNRCEFQGKVVAEPVESGDCYFLTLETEWIQRDPKTGTFSEFKQLVPLVVEPSSPAKNVVSRYVNEGHEVHVDTYYKTWEANGQTHYAFSVLKLLLGKKPFKPASNSGGPTPPPTR